MGSDYKYYVMKCFTSSIKDPFYIYYQDCRGGEARVIFYLSLLSLDEKYGESYHDILIFANNMLQ